MAPLLLILQVATLMLVSQPISGQQLCGMPADISLILDSSRSISISEYEKDLVKFVKSFVKMFKVGPKNVRFSLLTFGSEVYTQDVFNFDEYSTSDELAARLSTLKHRLGGKTYTHKAIRYAREKFFPTARSGVKKIAFLITDGKSSEEASTSKEAAKLKATGVTVYAIGVSNRIKISELKQIASSSDKVFQVETFAGLEALKAELAAKACFVPTTPPMIEPCGGTETDVIFAMDSSHMDLTNIRRMFDFIVGVIRREGVDYQGMRVGLLPGQCATDRGFALGEFQSKLSVGEYFGRLQLPEIQPLLKDLATVAFLPKYGGRKGARRVGVIVVPEKVTSYKGVLEEAQNARRNGVELFTVAVGNHDKYILNALVNSQEDHIIRLGSSGDLNQFVTSFVSKICKPSSTALPPTKRPISTEKPISTERPC